MADARSIVEQWYERFNGNDLAGFVDLMTDDTETVVPGAPTMTGKESFRAFAEVFKAAAPDSTIEVVTWVVDGDVVAVEGRFKGMHTGPFASLAGEVPGTGRAFDLGYAELLWVQDGKVARHHTYYDNVDFLSQLGLMPPPGRARIPTYASSSASGVSWMGTRSARPVISTVARTGESAGTTSDSSRRRAERRSASRNNMRRPALST